MAFSSVVSGIDNLGSVKCAYGTYDASGVTGGDIDTGLNVVYAMVFSGSGAAVTADMTAINETLPCDGSAVTIVTTSGATGYWFAIGR